MQIAAASTLRCLSVREVMDVNGTVDDSTWLGTCIQLTLSVTDLFLLEHTAVSMTNSQRQKNKSLNYVILKFRRIFPISLYASNNGNPEFRILFSWPMDFATRGKPHGSIWVVWEIARVVRVTGWENGSQNYVQYVTFTWPCIVTNFFTIKPTRCTNFTNLFWHETLHVSGQFVCPSSGDYSLYIQQWYMSYRFVDSCRAGAYAPARRTVPKHVESHAKINLWN